MKLIFLLMVIFFFSGQEYFIYPAKVYKHKILSSPETTFHLMDNKWITFMKRKQQ